MTGTGSATPKRERRTILDGGRQKAYRPRPEPERLAALAEGIEAYDRGHYFLAHELLEPPWMGTDLPAERALYQGLIKLAAAGVHWARRNPPGIRINLDGARGRLEVAAGSPPAAGPGAELDLDRLVAAVDRQLAGADPLGAPPAILRRAVSRA